MKEKYNILAVNGDKELLRRLEKELETVPFSLENAQTAAEAMEKVKSYKYHIVIIDTDLPDKSGIELLDEIIKYDSLAQIIITTQESTMDKILTSLERGANDYIAQPYLNLDELKKMIDYSVEKLERWRRAIIELVK